VQPNPTDEGRKHHDPVRANAEAEGARRNTDVRARRIGLKGGKKRDTGFQNGPDKGSKWNPVASLAVAETALIGCQEEPGPRSQMEPTIYISGGEGRASDTAP
jgi:hypothetical protein